MSIIKEISYFNSFLVKKAVEDSEGNPGKATWPGLPCSLMDILDSL